MLNNLISFDNKDSEDSLFVLFRLGEKIYAIHTSHTIELMKMPMLEQPQKLPKHIIGILNYNNLTINVLDLKSILENNRQYCSVDTQLMIVKTEESILGLAVDSILDVIPVPNSEMRIPPYHSDDHIIKMMYQFDTTLVSIIDLYAIESILKENESSEADFGYENVFPQDEKSKKVMRLRTEKLIKNNTSNFLQSGYDQDQFIIFNLSSSVYCINMKFVKEIVSISTIKITPLPYAPQYVDGVINLRGDFVTIINLKRFLGNNDAEISTPKKLLVLDSKDYKLAVSVDEVSGIKNLDNDQFIHRATNKLESKYTMAEFVEGEKVYYILNIEKFLNDEKLFINIE